MKESEMLGHMEAELYDFLERYQLASEKRRPYVVKSAAEGILFMQLGFGMLPPPSKKVHHVIGEQLDLFKRQLLKWEAEDEKK